MKTSSQPPPKARNRPRRPFGRSPFFWVGVGGGLGLIKPAPGTWGSLLGLPLAYFLSRYPIDVTALTWHDAVGPLWWFWMLSVAWASCGPTCRELGRKDPGEFVADEYVAFAGVYLFVPFTTWTAVVGFGLFRLFDIWKPWPVRWLDRRGGTSGVMLDDLAAAGLVVVSLLLFQRGGQL